MAKITDPLTCLKLILDKVGAKYDSKSIPDDYIKKNLIDGNCIGNPEKCFFTISIRDLPVASDGRAYAELYSKKQKPETHREIGAHTEIYDMDGLQRIWRVNNLWMSDYVIKIWKFIKDGQSADQQNDSLTTIYGAGTAMYESRKKFNAPLYDEGVYKYYADIDHGVHWFLIKVVKMKYIGKDWIFSSHGYIESGDEEVIYVWVPVKMTIETSDNKKGGLNSIKISGLPSGLFSIRSQFTANGVKEAVIYGDNMVSQNKNERTENMHDPIDEAMANGVGSEDGESEPEYQPEKLTTDLYSDMFSTTGQSDDLAYYHDLYWWAGQEYSAQSFESIVGIPVQFMSNTDMRAGQSRIGRTYTKDILYDAPVACIQAGAPALNDAGGQEGLAKIINALVETYSWIGAIKEQGLVQTFKEWLTANLMGANSRFYGFESQYGRMVHYTNTLCHLFASFLGISDKIIPGTNKRFGDYDDTIEEVEKDRGIGLKMVYGSYPAMFVYYQPDSALSQSFTNATQESSLAAKLNEVSNYTKEMSFLAGSLGIASGKGVTVGADVDVGPMFGLADTTFDFGNNLFQRIFARSAEGVGTIVGGNNLMLPEIYNSSNMSGTEYTLNVKLVNPYGSPEGAFLFQMRQLSRLLAISLPRQFGPNGYTAPFIIRAFSKGEFNVQLGIVESLSIKRAGQGGENRTIHGIPMELEVSMVIKDLYQQIAISNEYNDGGVIDQITSLGNLKQLKLLFNNIGLLDFVASYAGYNMNQPSIDMQIDYIQDSLKRNITDMVQFDAATKTWKFPRYHRMIWDSYMNTMNNHATWLAN